MGGNITLQVGVKILLKNEEGKYLLVRRSLDKYPEIKGRWDIVGGRIDAGKTLLENLQREVYEETNLKFVGTPKLIAAQDIFWGGNKHTVRLTYLGQAEGEVFLDIEENDKYHWYTKEDMLLLEDIDVYLKELLKSSPRTIFSES